ncbi:hypothetical protein [Pedobacter panaciterrae]|uniref:hypothetical protein n=1 Tax=Pedobacter panaciterrae TaxID=363849 RepID=UPI002596D010|nr:hypothetical protein [uncultured Pedobacter sp.]
MALIINTIYGQLDTESAGQVHRNLHYYKTYNTTATVETFFFGGYTMKKQSFSSSTRVFKGTQLAGILNTTAFAAGAIPNVIDSKPNAFLKKMVYYDGSGDSLVLERGDFRLY